MNAREPKYDICSGTPDKDAIWLEAVEGLANARARMAEIAAQKPGRYFIFSSAVNSIVAQIDTTKPHSKGRSA